MDVAIPLLLKETLKHIIFNIINTYNFDTEYFYSVKRIHTFSAYACFQKLHKIITENVQSRSYRCLEVV